MEHILYIGEYSENNEWEILNYNRQIDYCIALQYVKIKTNLSWRYPCGTSR